MQLFIRSAVVAVVAAAFFVPAQGASADALCGNVISAPGTTITLAEDLNCTGQGIIVSASDVTINLHGHTIYGDGPQEYDPVYGYPAGVTVYNATNTQIFDGNIKGFTHGIRVTRSNTTFIKGIATNSTKLTGIELDVSSNISLVGITMTGQGHDGEEAGGIVGTDVKNVSAVDIVSTGWGGIGVNINLVTGLSLTRVTAKDNAAEGINVQYSQGRVLIDHVAATMNLYGIRLGEGSGSSSVVISNSTASGNARHGFYSVNMPNAKLVKNSASANGGSGFVFEGGETTLNENSARANGVDGFSWLTSSRGSSSGDVSTQNQRHGMLLDAHGGNTVTIADATATDNRFTGLMASSGIVKVNRGSYELNGSDGIRAGIGVVDADRVTSSRNGGNGIAFLRGSNGSLSHVTSSKNRRYGICVDRAVHVRDVPPHVLVANTLGPRGWACTGMLVSPVIPMPRMP